MSGIQITKPTYAGSGELIHIGTASYRLCPGARYQRVAGGRFVWVYEYDGTIHAFTERGEVTVPEHIADMAEEHVFGV